MASKIQSKSEQNTKIIRQIGQLPHNKNCFDCGQKGPTYLNDTIGAFVCTGCSGILRGLNPPHRIKSISMGTFSDDEVKFIQMRGNAFCRKVWLWNYDPQIGPRPPEVRDDTKMKDFLSLKYEKKKWFHAAHDTHLADQLKQEDVGSVGSAKGPDSESSSLSRRTSTNSKKSFHNDTSPSATSNGASQNVTGNLANISLPRSHTSSSINHATPDRSSSATSDDLFSVFGGLTVSSPPATMAPPQPSQSQEWASFARSHTTPQFPPTQHAPPFPQPQQQQQQQQQQQSQPHQNNHFGQAAPRNSHNNQPIPFTTTSEPPRPLQPTTKPFVSQTASVSPAKPIAAANSDKYAALAELDEALNSSAPVAHKPVLPDPHAFLATSPQRPAFSWGAPAAVAPQYGAPAGANGFWADGLGHAPNQPQLDVSNVWGQMPAYGAPAAGGGMTNPFLAGMAPPPGASGTPRAPANSYNTNPFL